MGFYFYSTLIICLAVGTALYLTRTHWRPFAPPIPYVTAPGTIPEPIYNTITAVQNYIDRFRYVRLPQSATFAEDAEAGLHSSNFDLSGNIEEGDSRRGLDETAKREVYRIMKLRNVNFDEARRLFMEDKFGRAGIAADGRPLDRKAVMFS
ncbi:hypothetical protein LTR56_027230 [Elasticomyces elasticus]|nr:hypothetical protein LTR56_027230 [Elasticomyces elasticus]KAK3615938.1 hypothetical protein LTR22_027235 [Elasticomyces elasticus]KAK4898316.1 hypothetical protein LTR49_027833 [Elasticomyces elasticus]KAK5733798.1 hypothetical protein LTS12_026857 [Elasticomyces elasticus]